MKVMTAAQRGILKNRNVVHDAKIQAQRQPEPPSEFTKRWIPERVTLAGDDDWRFVGPNIQSRQRRTDVVGRFLIQKRIGMRVPYQELLQTHGIRGTARSD